MTDFRSVRDKIHLEFKNIEWIGDEDTIKRINDEVRGIEARESSRAIAKAKTFELLANESRIAIDKYNIFQNKLESGEVMSSQRERWREEVICAHLSEMHKENVAAGKCSAYFANEDFGHTSPNSNTMLKLGFTGLLSRIEEAEKAEGLTEKQKDFYESCKIVIRAMMTVAKRLSDAIRPYNTESADALLSLTERAPESTREAMQMIILYFFCHEFVAKTRVRTLGRVDVMLLPFWESDLKKGVKEEALRELLRYFLFKFSAANVDYGLPFCIGGLGRDGEDATNRVSHAIVEVFDELSVYSPKIHVRVSEKTDDEFTKKVLRAIRGGNSSFVLVNDTIGIEALTRVGIEYADALDYVPIGCYEPAVWGVEIGCTGNGHVTLPKAVELVFTGGYDHASGTPCGVKTEIPTTYEEFLKALEVQITYLTERALAYVTEIERYYDKINPDAILSMQYDESVRRGVDVYEGGAKYNNSSMYFYSIASFVDSVCAVKKFVFDEKRFTFEELGEILKSNWTANPKLRAEAMRIPEKYGNSNALADELTVWVSELCARLTNNKPNGRGGVFKAALFSINHCYPEGKNVMATPEGRLAGDPISKNLCASTAQDKNGITALINSVTKIDHAAFPTGSVLDVVIHPSAVSGEDGLDAFLGILKTYIARGGYALHGNVFDANQLRRAQREPEKYKNLQVRVCGWNSYFLNLSPEEQDAFIRQAENAG